MTNFFNSLANKVFYKKNSLAFLLLPFSWVYCCIVTGRRFLYKHNLLKTTIFPVPVIVIGNITVGGTGKTPLVISLANFFKAQGFHPGIVSRGYGGKAPHYPQEVTKTSDPAIVGDEPLLIVTKTDCPMMVSPHRVDAVQALLTKYACDLVISDDGLQHYALGRSLEVAVIDGERRIGVGYCLPVGPLREPLARLKSVDYIICNGGVAHANEVAMGYAMEDLLSVKNPALSKSLTDCKNQVIHAVAGIGNPQRFFAYLRAQGLNIITHEFPDHYRYQAKDFSFATDSMLIMTEKDAVKCKAFAGENYWYVPIKAILPTEFTTALLNKINLRKVKNENS